MSRNTKKAAVRQPSVFQLLQSKYLLTNPKPALTHRREVGTLDLKPVHRVKQVDKPISETGQEFKGRRFRVRDMIAKFAAAEKNEKDLETRDLVRQVSTGSVLSDMVKKLEDLTTVQKRNDSAEHKKQECAESKSTRMKKVTKQNKAQDLLILTKQERQVMGKYTSSGRHNSRLEEQQNPLATVKNTKSFSSLEAEQDLVSTKLLSSLCLPLTPQKVRYGKVKMIFFNALMVNSQSELEYGLLVMENT